MLGTLGREILPAAAILGGFSGLFRSRSRSRQDCRLRQGFAALQRDRSQTKKRCVIPWCGPRTFLKLCGIRKSFPQAAFLPALPLFSVTFRARAGNPIRRRTVEFRPRRNDEECSNEHSLDRPGGAQSDAPARSAIAEQHRKEDDLRKW